MRRAPALLVVSPPSLLLLLLLPPACAPPSLDGTNFACATDADCLDGKVCGMVNESRACIRADGSPIRIGLSAPFQGPSEDLGIEMRRGIGALFKGVNDRGGVFGRPLELASMNDNYDPDTALSNVSQLLDVQQTVADPDSPDVRGPNGVLALVGNVGTPTMLVTAPLANKNHVVFFAPFTGAQRYLRDGTNSPYVFNYRAGYYEETEAMVDYMASFRTPRIISAPDSYTHLIAFTQHDSYGDAGYAGLVLAYNARVAPLPQPDSTAPAPSIVRVTYEREDVASVDPAIAQAEKFVTALLDAAAAGSRVSVGVVMVDTYQPGNKFIRGVTDWLNESADRAARADILYMHVSFVGSDSLAQALTSAPESYLDPTDPAGQRRKSYAEGVMVTQVVPYYGSQAPGITAFRTDLAKYDGGANSFTSLEGYVVARLFVEALNASGPALSDDSLVDTLDTKMSSVDIGIGTLLGFSSTSHQACHTVWGSRIGADGSFTVPFIWNPQDRIIPGSM